MKISISLTLAIALVMPDWAQADIYMQQDADNEIVLTNVAPISELSNAVSDNKHDGSQRYILLVEDDVITDKVIHATKKSDHIPSLFFADMVASVARQTAIEPALLHAVISVESNYNPNALSPQGARGLMQLMPGTAKRFNVHNAYDPKQNVLAGAQYLRELQTLFKGNLQLMLAAYNAGPNAVTKYGLSIPPYVETQLYVPKVLRLYQKLSPETRKLNSLNMNF